MATTERLTAPALLRWAQASASALAEQAPRINTLNVFPIPDADTGSNMAHTMREAVNNAHTHALPALASELAAGAVRGARGNSGVVLSQVMRAIAETASSEGLSPEELIAVMRRARALVDEALHEPVEGTIISLLEAVANVEPAPTLAQTVQRMCDAALTALEHTPDQLPALREAGVVDAGGAGFVVMLSALQVILGEGELFQAPEAPSAEVEVMFFAEDCQLDALEAALDPLGTSIVIGRADEQAATVHIHTHTPGSVLSTALEHAKVSDVRIEALHGERAAVALCPPGTVSELFDATGVTPVIITDTTAAAIAQQLPQGQLIVIVNGMLDLSTLFAIDELRPGIAWLATGGVLRGIAAASVYDPSHPVGPAMAQLQEAVMGMRLATVVAEGERFVLKVGESRLGQFECFEAAIEAGCEALLASGGEQVTILSTRPVDTDAEVIEVEGLRCVAEIGVE